MRKNLISAIALALVAAAAGTASAGGQSGSLGVGAELDLSRNGGPSLNFDGGLFHAGGYLAFNNNDSETRFALGGRFFYHLHSTAMSDFGVGGTLTIENVNPDGEGADSQTNFYIIPGAQIRAFLSSNVAVSGGLGLAIAAGDASDGEGISLQGDIAGTFGFHYYFF
jgi:hypothetical protein